MNFSKVAPLKLACYFLKILANSKSLHVSGYMAVECGEI